MKLNGKFIFTLYYIGIDITIKWQPQTHCPIGKGNRHVKYTLCISFKIDHLDYESGFVFGFGCT